MNKLTLLLVILLIFNCSSPIKENDFKNEIEELLDNVDISNLKIEDYNSTINNNDSIISYKITNNGILFESVSIREKYVQGNHKYIYYENTESVKSFIPFESVKAINLFTNSKKGKDYELWLESNNRKNLIKHTLYIEFK